MIAVMGAGAFGTALAITLAHHGPVTLWARDADQARKMQETRENTTRLKGARLPENVTVSPEIGSVSQAQIVLLALPMQQLRGALTAYAAHLSGRSLVACCKGLETGTGARPSQIIAQTVSDAQPAMLTGPSFAQDIAQGLPTALTLACADDAFGAQLQQRLSTPTLRIYRSSDVIGAELGGALKNVIAIACGVAIGAGLGDSARAALLTRGFAEMVTLAETQGARAQTLSGLSGFGDLVLTCTSDQSRNYRFGLSLGQNATFDPAITVEGAATARALNELARQSGLDLPITRAVAGLVSGELQVSEAMDMLLSRPLKEE